MKKYGHSDFMLDRTEIDVATSQENSFTQQKNGRKKQNSGTSASSLQQERADALAKETT